MAAFYIINRRGLMVCELTAPKQRLRLARALGFEQFRSVSCASCPWVLSCGRKPARMVLAERAKAQLL